MSDKLTLVTSVLTLYVKYLKCAGAIHFDSNPSKELKDGANPKNLKNLILETVHDANYGMDEFHRTLSNITTEDKFKCYRNMTEVSVNSCRILFENLIPIVKQIDESDTEYLSDLPYLELKSDNNFYILPVPKDKSSVIYRPMIELTPEIDKLTKFIMPNNLIIIGKYFRGQLNIIKSDEAPEGWEELINGFKDFK